MGPPPPRGHAAAAPVELPRPRRIRLRQWQSEALGKLSASSAVDFLAVATPGAGKTTFALAAAVQHLSEEPTARVVVVAPTQHLKSQWASAAVAVGLHLDPSWSPRDGGVSDDMHGLVTTYQQVAGCARELAAIASGSFVVLDEVHHAGDDRSWGESVLTAFGAAARRLSLSGTPFRSDSSAIPFVDYHLDEARPDYEYGYGDALADRGVVRPVYFPTVGGFMEWVAPDGEVVAATFDDELVRERANQRLRTALSLEGSWMPDVLTRADERLADLRSDHPTAGGLVVASDRAHARAIASFLGRLRSSEVVVATSDDPDASARIRSFAGGTEPWIVAVRMVSEGVDIPRLRVAVHATTTTTELFFRQAVGRVVRHTAGVADQRAYVFIPDDPRLRRHASTIMEARRHSLRRRAEREAAAGAVEVSVAPDEQLSMFSVIGSAVVDGVAGGLDPSSLGVFGPEGAVDDAGEPPGVEVVLLPPPPPSGRAAVAPGSPGGAAPPTESLAERKERLRGANAEVAMELVRATGWGHAQVNRELNRLSGIDRVGGATAAQLDARLAQGRRWLRRC